VNANAKSALMIGLYLVAIVAANLLVAAYGPDVAVINAFLFIGLDITARDALHEAWKNEGLWWKMLLLIGTGSILSALLNANAARFALASFLAFAGAGIADTIVYHLLRDRARLLKINGSNVVSAAVDSVLFPALAFGFPLRVDIMIGQFVAKVLGGFIWSIILRGLEPRSRAQSAT
jgi:hypothetical protein